MVWFAKRQLFLLWFAKLQLFDGMLRKTLFPLFLVGFAKLQLFDGTVRKTRFAAYFGSETYFVFTSPAQTAY